MSSRALRRLEKSSLDGLSPEPVDEEPEFKQKPKFNAFALLNSDAEESDDNSEPEKAPVRDVDTQTQTVETTVSRKGKKKAKNKRSKGKAPRDKPDGDEDLDKFLANVKKTDQAQASKDHSVTPVPEESEDFEAILDEDDPPFSYTDSNYVYFTTARLSTCLNLLSIGSIKNLDPDNELKNLFGKISLSTIQDANSSTSMAVSPEVLAQFKKLARLTRGWGGKDQKSVPGTTRKLLLTRIKDDWLPTTKRTLGMEELSSDDIIESKYYKEEKVTYQTLKSKAGNEAALGIKYFRFTKTSSMEERLANSKFYAAVVITPDPDSLMRLLQSHPYHVETLLQMAMVILRQGNDKSTSSALIEKALFVFDRSFNKTFHELLQNGKTELVRLPYESFASRQFYLSIFRVITGLGERSTYFTALNYCKFLLALAPAEDPLGVRYFIDHYAIEAEEYQYLVSFVESPLTQTYTQWYTPGLAFSHVLALLSLDKKEDAQRAIESAFEAHYYCAWQLLRDLCLAQNIPVSESTLQPNDRVKIEAETYLVRAKVLWKRDQDIRFLHDNLLALFSRKAQTNTGSWISKLLGGYQSSDSADIPINLVRFVILSGENKVMAKIPEKIFSRDDVFEYDIMPPKDEAKRYDVFTGAKEDGKIADALIDHIDHNIISAIVQNQTGADFHEFLDLDAGQQGDAE